MWASIVMMEENQSMSRVLSPILTIFSSMLVSNIPIACRRLNPYDLTKQRAFPSSNGYLVLVSMFWLDPWFHTLWIFIIDPNLKVFLFAVKATFRKCSNAFHFAPAALIRMAPNFLAFESFTRLEMVACWILNGSASSCCTWHGSWSISILNLQTFSPAQ